MIHTATRMKVKEIVSEKKPSSEGRITPVGGCQGLGRKEGGSEGSYKGKSQESPVEMGESRTTITHVCTCAHTHTHTRAQMGTYIIGDIKINFIDCTSANFLV